MRLVSIFIFAAILSGAASWYFTGLYYRNMRENASEDIVAAEFRLLESVNDMTPPCESLVDHGGWVITQDPDHVVIWRLSQQSAFIEKFVINDDFESALDQIENTCTKK